MKSKDFYRPELDALRFFAFLSVFLFHGIPRTPITWYEPTCFALGSGMPLFFFLSAYLITELLIREHEKTNTINLKWFYVRRTLRIWPLYYLGVLGAIVASHLDPVRWPLSKHEILWLCTFQGWRGSHYHFNPFGVLWSVSVEEVFYLVLPTLTKFGGIRALSAACFLIIPYSLWQGTYHYDWFDPRPQALYFAVGTLTAIWLHGREVRIPGLTRLLMFVLAIAIWTVGGQAFDNPSRWGWYWGHQAALTHWIAMLFGVVLVFFAFHSARLNWPRPVLRLGQVSYGLYVYHFAAIALVGEFVAGYAWPRLGLAFLLSVGVSLLSFQYWERPFLQLKKKFQVVRAGAEIPSPETQDGDRQPHSVGVRGTA